MELILNREKFTEKSTIGRLTVDDKYICHILEDTDRGLENNPGRKVYGKSAIPRGRYRIVATMSNRFKKVLPLLKDVPGFEGIRIHPGNKPEDTDGCLLPGVDPSTDWVSQSVKTFAKVDALIRSALDQKEEVWITIA